MDLLRMVVTVWASNVFWFGCLETITFVMCVCIHASVDVAIRNCFVDWSFLLIDNEILAPDNILLFILYFLNLFILTEEKKKINLIGWLSLINFTGTWKLLLFYLLVGLLVGCWGVNHKTKNGKYWIISWIKRLSRFDWRNEKIKVWITFCLFVSLIIFNLKKKTNQSTFYWTKTIDLNKPITRIRSTLNDRIKSTFNDSI